MLAKKNVDDLSQPAREFYERSKLKLSASLFCVSVAFFMIGLCSEAGGRSLSTTFFMDTSTDDESLNDLRAGYGFACFLYILGFFIALASGIYISPYAGSKMESKILSTPQELDPNADVDPNNTTVNPAFSSAEPTYSGYPDPQSSVSGI